MSEVANRNVTMSSSKLDAMGIRSNARTIRGAIVGTVVEYYDFGIYGFMAAYIASLFFVQGDDNAAMLGTFATFAVAFFLRIPGGIIFGHIGDRYGRKKALTWTIILMAAATTLMGLLPTYETLGLWATLILVLARCLQGFAAGGELAGANAFVSETAPREWRATQTSMVNTGTYLGSLVASMVALTISSLVPTEVVHAWVWRLPFILSIFIGGIGIWIRNHLHETPQFEKIRNKGDTKKIPVIELLKHSWKDIVKIVLLGAQITGGYYISSVYVASYLQTVGHHSPAVAFFSTSIALIVGVIILPLAGYFADRFGRKTVLFTGSILGIVLGYPMFALMSGPAWQACLGQTVLFGTVSIVNGASYVTYVEMLKSSVRYSGLALGNNMTNMILGGTSPFIATWLIQATGSPMAPAAYFVVCALITFLATLSIRETKGIDLGSI
ncbi:MFS transporter [Ochrobactrum sp. Q0168]|uniref:MFS transporter n=1 Tax=Ochrobactrum sp. Q0168 TaxID=2793241 RepID=UPI0018EB5B42|nr:MFS transporter [Ochrobactrum sp. Q0168]